MIQLSERNPRRGETGGVTILVVFLILLLLTATAMGMSKNSLREVIASGVSRQGAMAANVADSGIEWSLFWMDTANANGAGGGSSAAALNAMKLMLLQDSTLAGKPYDPITKGGYDVKAPPAPQADLTVSTADGISQGFSIALTRMGKLPIADIGQTPNGGYTPAKGTESTAAPDLWAVRSDSQVTVGKAPLTTTFYHSKEGWLSTPVSNN